MVRVISDDGKQLGVMTLKEALSRAEDVGLDLVEVSSSTDPPVCKIMDYGKYRYKQNKKLHDARKSQTIIQVKEIKLKPKTEDHDVQVKMKHIRKFLKNNDKVKVSMMFRGREIAFTEIGKKLMESIRNELVNECTVDQEPRLEGRNMVMIFHQRNNLSWRSKNAKIKNTQWGGKAFSITANGKIKRNKAFASHILTKKTRKKKRLLRKGTLVDSANQRAIKRLLPYR